MAASSSKKIILKSNDGKNFEVDKAVALQLQIIKYPIEQDWADTCFPLPNVKGDVLSKVIDYCKMHSDDVPDYKLKSFDAQFVNVEKRLLFDLALAANYLEIEGLLDLTCKAMADKTEGKTLEEIRTFFDTADFDQDGENPWGLE